MGNTTTTNPNKSKKDKNQEKQAVIPYREGSINIAHDSKLKEFLLISQSQLETNSHKNKFYLYVEDLERKERLNKDIKNETISQEIQRIENLYFPGDQKEVVREDFENYSKENKMGKKKLLEYFGLLDLDQLEMGNRFFHAVKNFSDDNRLSPYLDYKKFLKTLALLSQKNETGRIIFLFKLFDINLEGHLTKDQLRQTIKIFLEGMLAINYESFHLNQLKKQIIDSHERMIDIAIEDMCSDIFSEFSKQQAGELDFEEWKNWIVNPNTMCGMQEVLVFEPDLKQYQNRSSTLQNQ